MSTAFAAQRCLAGGSLALGLALFLPMSSARAQDRALESSPLPFAEQVAQALAAAQDGDYQAALQQLSEALPRAPGATQRAALHFNIGICSMELGRAVRAEEHFERAAQVADYATTARLHASLAAIAQDQIERAAQHLARAEPASEEELQLSREVQRRLQEARLRAARGWIAADEPERALRALHDLLNEDPRHALAWIELGLLFEEQDRRHAAVEAFARAERVAQTDEERARARTLRHQLSLIGRSGWRGRLSVGAGMDTNAAQSGSAGALGLVSRDTSPEPQSLGDIRSGVVETAGSLAYGARLADRWSLEPELGVHLLQLTHEDVSSTSTVTTHARVGTVWEPAELLAIGLDAGVRHTRLGTSAQEAFTTQLELAVDTLADLDAWGLLEAELGVQPRWHHSGAALDGWTAHVGLGLTRYAPRWSFGIGLSGWQQTAGRDEFPANTQLIPRCVEGGLLARAVCNTLTFSIPLSYRAAQLELRASYAPSSWLRLGIDLSAVGRWYLEEATLQAGREGQRTVPGSNTLRREQSLLPSTHLSVRPLREWPAEAWLQYSLKLNHSNLTGDLNDPEHQFDYEDRNFTQHLFLAGLRALL